MHWMKIDIATSFGRWTVAALVFCVFNCHADPVCTSLAEKATQAPVREDYDVSACKALPDEPGKSILVLRDKVLIVDSSDGHILSEGKLPGVRHIWRSAAIDTAAYWLAPHVRAFAIRQSMDSHSYDTSESDDVLTLYVVHGSAIDVLIESLVVRAVISSNGCDDGGESPRTTCHLDMDETRRTLAIANTSHQGYADIHVYEAARACTDGVRGKTSCRNFDSAKFGAAKWKAQLLFNGSRYAVPDDLQNGVLLQ